MGVGRRAALACRLIDRGWRAARPAAVIVDASRPTQHGLARHARSSWRPTRSTIDAGRCRHDRDRRGGRGRTGSDRMPSGPSGHRSDARSTERALCQSVDDSKTFGRARLSFASEADIDEFVTTLEQLRARRDDARPVARLPAGARHLRPAPGRGRADAARQDSAGHADQPSSSTRSPTSASATRAASATSRPGRTSSSISSSCTTSSPRMRRLADAGLTTREACGNSVRNITACPYAGVAADELFDVTPYAEAMTRFLLRHPLSSTLPRKFKIAFEGCAGRSHRARRSTTSASARWSAPDGGRGFRVTAGGGTAIMTTTGTAAARVPAGVRDLPRRRSGAARVPAARRLQAQAAQPHEVHDQDARLDALARGVRPRARPPAGCAARCRRSRSIRRRAKSRPDWPLKDRRRELGAIASRVSAAGSQRARA